MRKQETTAKASLRPRDEDEFGQVAKRIRMMHKEARAETTHDRDISASGLAATSASVSPQPVARLDDDAGQVEHWLPKVAYISLSMVLAVACIALIALLAEEQQQSGTLEHDLASARRSIEELQAKVEPAAAGQAAAAKSRQAAEALLVETRQALEEERQISGLLERDLAEARRSIEELQTKPAAVRQAAAAMSPQVAAEAPLAETRQALEAERQKSGLLERDLASARRSLEELQAKVEPAAAEQAAAAKSRQAAEALLAETRQALEEERQKSGLLGTRSGFCPPVHRGVAGEGGAGGSRAGGRRQEPAGSRDLAGRDQAGAGGGAAKKRAARTRAGFCAPVDRGVAGEGGAGDSRQGGRGREPTGSRGLAPCSGAGCPSGTTTRDSHGRVRQAGNERNSEPGLGRHAGCQEPAGTRGPAGGNLSSCSDAGSPSGTRNRHGQGPRPPVSQAGNGK